MQWLWWCLGAIIVIALFVLLLSFICYRRTFYFKQPKNGKVAVVKGVDFEPYREQIKKWYDTAKDLPHEDMEIESFDGLKLRGRYFEYKPEAPIEIIFHGYKGNADRDLCGGIERCFALGRSALIVDHRACGKSEGHVISFGINERKDCKKWVEYAIERFGKDVRLGITGVSMGAATVIMAAADELPDNVRFVLADCPYSSPKEIIKRTMAGMHLPPTLLYPFVKLGARIYGDFDLEEASPIEAVKSIRIPIIFIHGGNDTFVPFNMSRRMYEACPFEKKHLVEIPDVGHGMAYPAAKDAYIEALRAFEKAYKI